MRESIVVMGVQRMRRVGRGDSGWWRRRRSARAKRRSGFARSRIKRAILFNRGGSLGFGIPIRGAFLGFDLWSHALFGLVDKMVLMLFIL
jgi:hypothetical protein